MHFVDRALARRLESAEEMPQVYHAEWCQKNQAKVGAAVEKISGGHMIFAGLGSPIGRAVASLLELTKERGYGIAELNNVLVRKLDSTEKFSVRSEFTIRAGKQDEALAFSSILRRSFFPDGGEPGGFDEMLSPMFAFPGSLAFVAEMDGQLVATGAGLIIPEHKIVGLYGAGTLNEYRRRGLQTAMLERRMQAAAEAGCEYAVIVTLGGTTSQRNAERLGFRVAYSKATLIKQPPA